MWESMPEVYACKSLSFYLQQGSFSLHNMTAPLNVVQHVDSSKRNVAPQNPIHAKPEPGSKMDMGAHSAAQILAVTCALVIHESNDDRASTMH